MLKADVSLESKFSLYKSPGELPGAPEQAMCLRVSFAGPLQLIAGWWAVHISDRYRVRRGWALAKLVVAALAIAAVVGAIAMAQFHQIELFGKTPVPLDSSGASGEKSADKERAPRLHKDGIWAAFIEAPETGAANFWIRTTSLALGLPFVFGALLILSLRRRPVCKVYLVVLRPHQPFPAIDRQLARSDDTHVFAVRALGRDVRSRFFRLSDEPETSPRTLRTTSLQVTHQHCASVAPPDSRLDPVSYWCLIRFAIGLMLPPQAGSTGRAMRFTYKQHEVLFLGYVLLLGAALVLPATGWVASAESTQFPLIMAGLGIMWAFVGLATHRGKSGHLAEWERLTLDYPFRGCPLYRYSDEDGSGGSWQLLYHTDFRKPIRDFGLDYSNAQQFVLGIMLVSYFAVLALVK